MSLAIIKKLRQYRKRIGTCTRVYRSVPRGIDFYQDVTTHLPNQEVRVVMDVGANEGQTARKLLKCFPKCRIHCFEPVQTTYEILRRKFNKIERVECHRVALGSIRSMGHMLCKGTPDTFALHNAATDVSESDRTLLKEVEVVTVDTFCSDHGLAHVNFLKIDTEGGDMEVLMGAEAMLSTGSIDLVKVEAGMNPTNSRHVPFEQLKAFLEERDYCLFALYEQIGEKYAKQPHLRRANAVFLSPNTRKTNTLNRTR